MDDFKKGKNNDIKLSDNEPNSSGIGFDDDYEDAFVWYYVLLIIILFINIIIIHYSNLRGFGVLG